MYPAVCFCMQSRFPIRREGNNEVLWLGLQGRKDAINAFELRDCSGTDLAQPAEANAHTTLPCHHLFLMQRA